MADQAAQAQPGTGAPAQTGGGQAAGGQEAAPHSANVGQQGQSSQGQQTQGQAAWGGTFKSPEAMWDSYRELQGHTGRTQAELRQHQAELQKLKTDFESSQKLLQETGQWKQNLVGALTGQNDANTSALAQAQLAKELLENPNGVIGRILEERMKSAVPELLKQHVDPLRQSIEQRQNAELEGQKNATLRNWYQTYGNEFCDGLSNVVQQESEQLGPGWLQRHKDPVFFDMRLRLEYLQSYVAQLQEAMQKNDSVTIKTMLAKQAQASPSGAPTMPHQGTDNISAIGRDMEEAFAKL